MRITGTILLVHVLGDDGKTYSHEYRSKDKNNPEVLFTKSAKFKRVKLKDWVGHKVNFEVSSSGYAYDFGVLDSDGNIINI